MRSVSLASVFTFAATLVIGGCSASEPEGGAAAAPAEQEQDFVSRGGVTLKAASDPGLKISLQMLDGVKTRTKNQRFVKATVYRGAKSFGAFCDLRGDVETGKESATIACGLGVTTVSNDDDESLSFDLVLTRGPGGDRVTLANVGYFGDGTFLGNEAGILGHADEAPLPLDAQEANNLEKNPLRLARHLLDATKPLLTERVQSEEVDAPVAVKSASFSIDKKLDMTVSLALGRNGRLFASVEPQSALKTKGNLASGMLDAGGLTARLRAALPR